VLPVCRFGGSRNYTPGFFAVWTDVRGKLAGDRRLGKVNKCIFTAAGKRQAVDIGRQLGWNEELGFGEKL